MKKLNNLFAILVAMAMVLSLTVISAFAAENYAANDFTLTKELQMPTGTNTPGITFTYTITPSTEPTDQTATETPTIQPKTITYTANGSAADQSLTAAEIFNGITFAPGKYVYIIDENDDSQTANVDGKTFTYDPAQYKLTVYQKADGTRTYTLYKRTNPQSDWTKVPAEGEEGSASADAKFTNTYVKTTVVNPNGDEENPSNDSAGYAFEKFIENDDGGLYTDKAWAFTVEVTKPDLSKKTAYTYQIWDVGTTGVEGTAKMVSTNTITAGATFEQPNVTLKAGQRLVFTDLDVGATVKVKEADTNDITEGATLKVGSADPATYAILTGTATPINDGVANYLEVTNLATQNTQPEGILISNLPYIALALVAIGGLVAYVVVRRRNADEA